MNTKIILSLALVSFITISCDLSKNESKQKIELKQIIDTPKAEIKKTEPIKIGFESFIPENYAVLDSQKGDLNLDKIKDVILVLKKIDEEKESDTSKSEVRRPLIILLGKYDGSFTQVARNDNAVYCVTCGGVMGDPFVGVVITEGCFSIEHYGGSVWRWSTETTFKYSEQKKTWLLHKKVSEEFNATEPAETKTTTETAKTLGTVKFQDFDIYK